jgi:hypothetical protein
MNVVMYALINIMNKYEKFMILNKFLAMKNGKDILYL